MEKEAFPEEDGKSRKPRASETRSWSFKGEECAMMPEVQ